MKNSSLGVKTLLLSLAVSFSGRVSADAGFWFSGTAEGTDLAAVAASWVTNGLSGEVSVANSILEIDLPTNEVVKLTPTTVSPSPGENKKTYVAIDDAVFTATAVEDIDSTVVQGAQTALTVAYDTSNVTHYYAYITNNWVKLLGANPVEGEVDVSIELDYSNPAETNASFKVGNYLLKDEFDNETFPISGSQRALARLEFAGYGKLHAVTTTVEAVSTVTVSNEVFTYGADFTNVTITATVDGSGYAGADYTLTWDGKAVAAADMTATVYGNTLTITANIPPPATGRNEVTYSINVNGSGEQRSTVVAEDRLWVLEDSANHATGTWEPAVSYAETVASVADSTYTANGCSTGDLVTVTFENIIYTELSDLTVETPEGTQGAFALAETNINAQVSTNFMILAKEGGAYVWKPAQCAGVTATTNVPYTVVMTFNYTNRMYSVTVSDGTTTAPLTVNAAAAFDLCDAAKEAVSAFDFKGSGTMTAIKGVDSIGYMAKDGNGNWFATISAAIGSGLRGPFIVLRATSDVAPNGWKFVTVDGVTLLKKAVKGVLFFVH